MSACANKAAIRYPGAPNQYTAIIVCCSVLLVALFASAGTRSDSDKEKLFNAHNDVSHIKCAKHPQD